MKCNEINIRDPYVPVKDGKYYMYGTLYTSYDFGGRETFLEKSFPSPKPPSFPKTLKKGKMTVLFYKISVANPLS